MTKIKRLDDIPEFQKFKENYIEVNRLAVLAGRDPAIPVATTKEATALVLEGATLLKNEFSLEAFADNGAVVGGATIDQQHIDRLKQINGKIEAILDAYLPADK